MADVYVIRKGEEPGLGDYFFIGIDAFRNWTPHWSKSRSKANRWAIEDVEACRDWARFYGGRVVRLRARRGGGR